MKNIVILVTIMMSVFSAFAYVNMSNESNITDYSMNYNIVNSSNITIKTEIELNPYSNTELDNNVLKNNYKINKGISQKAKDKQRELNSDNIHMVIQFNRNPSKNEIKELENNGIKILNYLSNNVYYVTINNNLESIFNESEIALKLKNENIQDKYLVRAVDTLDSEYKKSNLLQKNQIGDWGKSKDGRIYLTIRFYNDVSLKDAKKIVSKYNIKILSEWNVLNSLNVLVDEKDIDKIAKLDEVESLQEKYPYSGNELEYSKGYINADYVQSIYNLLGEGITIFQYETNVPDINHPDLEGRVSWTGDTIDPIGHATQVAGILIGNGTVNSNKTGIAPKATIRADEIDTGEDYNNTGGSLGMPYDYWYGIHEENVDLASNSWGDKIKDYLNSTNKAQLCLHYGDYENVAELLDTIVYGNLSYLSMSAKSIPIVFSVGNERNGATNPCNTTEQDYNPNYPYKTINTPKTAKNIISVGNIYGANNAIAYNSAYGPTDDGRLKPELVAPGTLIITTNSSNEYDTVSGTSFAAPHVSGTIALMLEQWNKSNHSNTPLPSTIKALLLDSTTDLENDGLGNQLIDGPDYINGYGLLNAKGAVDRIRNGTFLEANISNLDDIDVYALNITNQTSIKVTLAWDDIPGANLINDLNLYLISPKGTKFHPWTLNPQIPNASAIRNESDHLNVVEQVYVNSSEISQEGYGEWLVVVDATVIPYDEPQKYSLVSENEIKTNISKLIPDSSLKLYYSLDGTQMQNKVSPNDYGTIYGAFPSTDRNSNPNSSYEFDGTDDYILIDSNQNSFDITKDFTVSFWAYLDNNTGDRTFLSLEAAMSSITYNNAGLAIFYNNVNYPSNTLTLFTGTGVLSYSSPSTALGSSTILNENNWYHLTFTRKNNIAKIFINGEIDSKTSSFNTYDIDWTALDYLYEHDNNVIATWKHVSSTFRYLDGKMDELTIWNRALEDYEIQKLYKKGLYFEDDKVNDTVTNPLPIDNSVRLYYTFDGNLNDSSYYNKDATQNAGASLTSDRNSNPNSSYEFDGIDDYILIDSNEKTFNIAKDFSIAFWVYLDNNTGDRTFLSLEAAMSSITYNNAGLAIFYNNVNYPSNTLTLFTGTGVLSYSSPSTALGSSTVLNENRWYHLIFTRENNVAKIFIDGQIDSSTANFNTYNIDWTASGSSYEHDNNAIGTWKHVLSTFRYLDGKMDELIIWNRALNSTEISQVYNYGVSID